VPVGDRTYYGCCEGCKQRLRNEPEVRTARDPVSGEPVDKASAIIGRQPDGHVLYFASEETFNRYQPGAR